MKVALTNLAALALMAALTMGATAQADPEASEQKPGGSAAANSSVDSHSTTTNAPSKEVVLKAPVITVTGRRTTRGFPFLRGITACGACPACRIVDEPYGRRHMEARWDDDRGSPCSAVIMTDASVTVRPLRSGQAC